MRAVLGLGSNLGDRLVTLREAASRLSRVATILARSRIYETEPVGGVPQPAYLNAALAIAWTGSPVALLDEAQRIEIDLGRDRAAEGRWGARTCDVDILWIEGVTIADERLVVPHPRLAERAFALAPLLDVAPDARDPKTGAPYVLDDGAGVRVTTLAW